MRPPPARQSNAANLVSKVPGHNACPCMEPNAFPSVGPLSCPAQQTPAPTWCTSEQVEGAMCPLVIKDTRVLTRRTVGMFWVARRLASHA